MEHKREHTHIIILSDEEAEQLCREFFEVIHSGFPRAMELYRILGKRNLS